MIKIPITIFVILALAGPALAAPKIFMQHTVDDAFVTPAAATAADFDLDGDMDILASGSTGILWYENDGTGAFTAHQVSAASSSCKPQAADLSGDGVPDILCGMGSYGWGFTWWEKTVGGFTRHDVDPAVGDYQFDSFFEAVAVDMDGDGDLDVVVSGGQTTAKSFAWWENTGGGWTRHIFDGVYDSSTGISVVNLNQTGGPDILLTSLSGNYIVWWRNDGAGSFTEFKIGDCLLCDQATAVDLDGDGDLDLLSAGGFNVGFQWWENDGSMNFTPHTIKGGAVIASSIAAADLDNDGDLDILGSDGGNHRDIWWENDGEQNFTERPVATDIHDGISIVAADFNGDGNTDVLDVLYYQNQVLWWENELPANPSFDEGVTLPSWWTGRNLAPDDGRNTVTIHSGAASFKLGGSALAKSLFQTLYISGKGNDSFTLEGWSRARFASPTGGPYCLEAKVYYNNGTSKTYRAPFTKGSHAWEYREKTFVTTGPYSAIVLSVKYGNQTGKAFFDDVLFRPN